MLFWINLLLLFFLMEWSHTVHINTTVAIPFSVEIKEFRKTECFEIQRECFPKFLPKHLWDKGLWGLGNLFLHFKYKWYLLVKHRSIYLLDWGVHICTEVWTTGKGHWREQKEPETSSARLSLSEVSDYLYTKMLLLPFQGWLVPAGAHLFSCILFASLLCFMGEDEKTNMCLFPAESHRPDFA